MPMAQGFCAIVFQFPGLTTFDFLRLGLSTRAHSVIPSEARDLEGHEYRSLASLGMTPMP